MDGLRTWAHRFMGTRTRKALSVAVAAMIGVIAFTLAAQSAGTVGPLTIGVRLGPTIDGHTTLAFPPFGRVTADTHAGPLDATATLEEVDIEALRELATRTELPREEIDGWADDLRSTVARAAILGLVAGLAAACAVAWMLTRSWRATVAAAMVAIAIPGSALAAGTLTFDEQAFSAPTYEGALTYAPAAFGLVQQKVSDIRGLQQQASGLAAELSAYYGTEQSFTQGGTLPGTYRVLHVSDLHLDPVGMQLAIDLAVAYDVDFVIDTGDVSYFGSDQEGALAAAQLSSKPYIFVPGNHDSQPVLDNLAGRGNVTVLDGETTTTASGVVVLGVGDPAGADDTYMPDREAATDKGERIARAFRGRDVDIVAVHNPVSGEAFAGRVPVVLSGHTHSSALETVDGTVYLGAGTTGGVNFNDLADDPHIPHSASVLYFSIAEPGRLVAIDQIEVYGRTRQSSIRRTVVDETFLTQSE